MTLKHKLLFCAPLGLMLLGGCTRDYKFQPVDMWNSTRLKPYEQVNFFDNKNSSRTPPTGTVARGQLRIDEQLYYGTENGTLIEKGKNPLFLQAKSPDEKLALIQRGQERYNIYCQPCHGLNGSGDGLIVKRGFAAPPSYHIERLQEAPDGHLFDVMTNGYGSMYSYASRVPTRDRWAIVAYIRTLQLSQDAGSDTRAAAAIAKAKGGENKVEPNLTDRTKWVPSPSSANAAKSAHTEGESAH
jgi:mono/diheme cytochrome c family protein